MQTVRKMIIIFFPGLYHQWSSSDSILPQVLSWLKHWDSCVFGTEIRSTSEEVLSSLRRHSSTQHQKSFDSSFSRKSRGHRWSNGSYRPMNNVDHVANNLKGMQDLSNKKSRPTGPPEQKVYNGILREFFFGYISFTTCLVVDCMPSF